MVLLNAHRTKVPPADAVVVVRAELCLVHFFQELGIEVQNLKQNDDVGLVDRGSIFVDKNRFRGRGVIAVSLEFVLFPIFFFFKEGVGTD